MKETILGKLGTIQDHVNNAKTLIEDPELVLREIQRMNLHVQELLLFAHRYRVEEMNKADETAEKK